MRFERDLKEYAGSPAFNWVSIEGRLQEIAPTLEPFIIEPIAGSRTVIIAPDARQGKGTGSLAWLLAEYMNAWALIGIAEPNQSNQENMLSELEKILNLNKLPLQVIALYGEAESKSISLSIMNTVDEKIQGYATGLQDAFSRIGSSCSLMLATDPKTHASSQYLVKDIIEVHLPEFLLPPVATIVDMSKLLDGMVGALRK